MRSAAVLVRAWVKVERAFATVPSPDTAATFDRRPSACVLLSSALVAGGDPQPIIGCAGRIIQ